MARLEFKHYSNLSAFRTIPIPLFQRLLSFHEEFRAAAHAHGLLLESLTEDDASREQLWRFFTDHGSELPKALLKAMHEIDDLSTETGHQLLIDAARLANLVLPPEAEKWTAHQLAITLWMENLNVFYEARDRNFIQQIKNFHEFVPAQPRPLEGTPDWPTRLTQYLKPLFHSRLLGTACDIRRYEDDHAFSFVISRGKPYRADETQEDSGPSVIAWRPRKHDLVILDKRTGRLRINTDHMALITAYRQAFGTVFFGSAEHFAAYPIVSLAPLWENQEAVLRPTPGIRAVTLIEVWQELGQGTDALVVCYQGKNLLSALKNWEELPMYAGRPVFAVLHILYEGSVRARRLEIDPPRKVRFDPRRDRDVTILFLETHGFLTNPSAATLEPIYEDGAAA